jgi:hypothetical protein
VNGEIIPREDVRNQEEKRDDAEMEAEDAPSSDEKKVQGKRNSHQKRKYQDLLEIVEKMSEYNWID